MAISKIELLNKGLNKLTDLGVCGFLMGKACNKIFSKTTPSDVNTRPFNAHPYLTTALKIAAFLGDIALCIFFFPIAPYVEGGFAALRLLKFCVIDPISKKRQQLLRTRCLNARMVNVGIDDESAEASLLKQPKTRQKKTDPTQANEESLREREVLREINNILEGILAHATNAHDRQIYDQLLNFDRTLVNKSPSERLKLLKAKVKRLLNDNPRDSRTASDDRRRDGTTAARGRFTPNDSFASIQQSLDTEMRKQQ